MKHWHYFRLEFDADAGAVRSWCHAHMIYAQSGSVAITPDAAQQRWTSW